MRYVLEPRTPELRGLLADIYRLTSIKICIFDREGRELCYYPERLCRVCAGLREDAAFDKRCRQCDAAARAECASTRCAQIYTCHAGLTECIAPICRGGEISGYIVLGQIRRTQRLSVLENDPRAELRGEFDAMPLIAEETIVAALHIVQACAEYERLREYIAAAAQSFSVRLGAYVEKHLAEKIGVESMMRELGVSRVELYRRTYESFGQSPAEYLREQRLLCARRLLSERPLSVAQVAERCGIGDYNYFAKMFKKRFGCSARAVRAEAVKKQGER